MFDLNTTPVSTSKSLEKFENSFSLILARFKIEGRPLSQSPRAEDASLTKPEAFRTAVLSLHERSRIKAVNKLVEARYGKFRNAPEDSLKLEDLILLADAFARVGHPKKADKVIAKIQDLFGEGIAKEAEGIIGNKLSSFFPVKYGILSFSEEAPLFSKHHFADKLMLSNKSSLAFGDLPSQSMNSFEEHGLTTLRSYIDYKPLLRENLFSKYNPEEYSRGFDDHRSNLFSLDESMQHSKKRWQRIDPQPVPPELAEDLKLVNEQVQEKLSRLFPRYSPAEYRSDKAALEEGTNNPESQGRLDNGLLLNAVAGFITDVALLAREVPPMRFQFPLFVIADERTTHIPEVGKLFSDADSVYTPGFNIQRTKYETALVISAMQEEEFTMAEREAAAKVLDYIRSKEFKFPQLETFSSNK